MFETFSRYLVSKATFSTDELLHIKKVCRERELDKGELLADEGQLWPYNGFVCTGLLRNFTVDRDGVEHTTSFASENYWTGSRESLLTGNPMPFSIGAIEASEVLLIEKNDFDILRRDIQPFNDMMSSLIQKNLTVTQSGLVQSFSLSDPEKYDAFLKRYPKLHARAPYYMVASCLDMPLDRLMEIIALREAE